MIVCCLMNDGARAMGLAKMSGASIYPSAQNILLAARALGLASVLTTLHLLYEKDVKEALGLPENAETFAILPIGWPMGKFGPVSRELVESVTFFNQWGSLYHRSPRARHLAFLRGLHRPGPRRPAQ
jgi:nitroreductase